MNFENLGKVNKIYNFQDTIIPARHLSHAPITFKNYLNIIHVNVILQVFSVGASKDIRVNATQLPTDAEHVRFFEKTLTGGFSCLNTRLAFDTQILISDKKNEKVLFDLKIDGKKQTK